MPAPTVRGLLKRIREDGAYAAPPAEPYLIEGVVETLTEAGSPPLPDDLAAFLAVADGFAWNGVMLYGIEEREAPDGTEEAGTTIPAIVDANAEFVDREGEEAMLVVGGADEDLFVFSMESGSYAILDATDLTPMDSFPDLLSLLSSVVDERI